MYEKVSKGKQNICEGKRPDGLRPEKEPNAPYADELALLFPSTNAMKERMESMKKRTRKYTNKKVG